MLSYLFGLSGFMKKLVFLFLLFLFGSAFALSSTEVTNFFKSESHYLDADQSFSETPFFVKHDGKSYWVVVLISERTPTGFVAVFGDRKEVVETDSINRNLFKTGYVVYSVSSYMTSQQWIFSNSNKGKFDTLSKILSSEVPFKLNSIKESTTDSEIRSKVDVMLSMLALMSAKAEEIEIGFDNVISLELNYVNNPETEDTEKLKKEYKGVIYLLDEFEDLKLDYSLGVFELKKAISESALDATEKQQFLALANEPQQLSSIDSIFSLAEDASQRIEEIYSSANSKVSGWVENIDLMVQRNSAFDEIYSEDKGFYSKTKNYFWNLNDAHTYITNEENSSLWKEQSRVSSIKKNFSEAEKAFEQKNYQKAVSSAQKAKNDAIAIVAGGFYDNSELPIDPATLIIALVVLLALLLLFNNRKKFFSSKEEVSEFKFQE